MSSSKFIEISREGDIEDESSGASKLQRHANAVSINCQGSISPLGEDIICGMVVFVEHPHRDRSTSLRNPSRGLWRISRSKASPERAASGITRELPL